jgi:D-sedoheptulose 7-phosphate isomerase
MPNKSTTSNMDLQSLIQKEFIDAQSVLDTFISNNLNFHLIEQSAFLMAECLRNGGKIISCGNGGSHCDAMHFAEELTGRYRHNRRPLAAIAISDPSYLSCVGNDFGYEYVFSRFVESIGNEGDVLLAISTSGQSKSIMKAVEMASNLNMKIVILTGKDGGQLKGEGDVVICVPHYGFADRIQEIHIKIIHTLILSIEQLLNTENEISN